MLKVAHTGDTYFREKFGGEYISVRVNNEN